MIVVKIFLDCLPCFLRQVLDSTRIVTGDLKIQNRIMEDTIALVADYKSYKYSPELGRDMHRIINNHTGEKDTYKEIKKNSIKLAEEMYPYVKEFLHRRDNDRLYWALKASAIGNSIDYAINSHVDIKNCVETEIEKEFSICDIDSFKDKLKGAKTILVIGDNAGETVFDRVLIEELLQYDIFYAVRSEAIINDATYEDACDSGLNHCCKIISNGCNAPGLILEEGSEEFLEIYDTTDIVISKGQGNYETLSDQKREMFFLLKVKCHVLSKQIGVPINSYVFMRNKIIKEK